MSQVRDNMGIKDVSETLTHITAETTAASVATKWGMGGGTVTSIFGWLTSNGSAVAIGILVTIAGFMVNYFFQRRRDKREADHYLLQHQIALAEERRKNEMHEAQLAAIRSACPVPPHVPTQ